MEKELKPLIPSWLLNPPRLVWWRSILIGLALIQVVFAFSGGWTWRHTLSLPTMVLAFFVAHPVMDQRLPLFRSDILKSSRIYLAIGLVVIANLIELRP